MFPTGNYVTSSPAVVNGVVYVGSFDNNTYALDAATGALRWNLSTGYDICMQSSPAVHGDLVYTGSSNLQSFTSSGFIGAATDDDVYSINATTGVATWNYTINGGVWSSPAASNAMIYVGSGNNKLYALDVSTGAFRWSYETEGAIYSSPAFAGGVIYVGSADNKIYAIGLPPPVDTGWPTITYLAFVLVVAVVVLGAVITLLFFKRRRQL